MPRVQLHSVSHPRSLDDDAKLQQRLQHVVSGVLPVEPLGLIGKLANVFVDGNSQLLDSDAIPVATAGLLDVAEVVGPAHRQREP